MKDRVSRGLFFLYVLPILLGLGVVACSGDDSSGCGKSSKTVKCGEGTKKVSDGDGYKCVPNR